MHNKRACIIIDLRTGEHVVNVPGIAAVLTAAGWKTKISLKEYGGETIQLAKKAAKKNYDLVIGYGGDGTLTALLNGIAYVNGKSTAAGIPGGTFNVWASTIGIPNDPIKATLALINSEPRTIDLGHLEVTGLTPANDTENSEVKADDKKVQKKARRSEKNRQYFLLNVGLGLDAKMMNNISKPLKYRIGPLAFDLSNAQELPKQHPFPVEVQQINDTGHIETSWQGEVWQIYVSKVPLFGGSMRIETEARADDGLLYLCLITANGPIKTMEQVLSFLTHHTPDKETTKYFHGTHFIVRAPASVDMHIDGSISKLEDLLHLHDRTLLQQITDTTQLIVNYRFDIKPKAAHIAIPRTYDGPLFAKRAPKENTIPDEQDAQKGGHKQAKSQAKSGVQDKQKGQADQQREVYKITVIGTVLHQENRPVFIVAGHYKQQSTHETQVVALRVTEQTQVLNKEGEHLLPESVLELQEGQAIIVEGEKSKRGVIGAMRIREAN